MHPLPAQPPPRPRTSRTPTTHPQGAPHLTESLKSSSDSEALSGRRPARESRPPPRRHFLGGPVNGCSWESDATLFFLKGPERFPRTEM